VSDVVKARACASIQIVIVGRDHGYDRDCTSMASLTEDPLDE